MAVVIETTLGDITVDLFLKQRPVTCLNFLKLCKMKYYNFNLFHSIRSGFIAQTGDPTGEGNGGESIFGLIEGPEKRFFSGEKMPKIRHTDTGLLSMVGTGDAMIGSQFFFTLGSDLDSLDGTHCVIGEVTEGHDVLRKLNEVICDETHRPYQDVRITHTVILEDPFSDPTGLRAPSRSPSPSAQRLKGGRIAPDEELDEAKGKSAAEVQEMIEEKEAKARATILEIVGDIPDADIAPPENVLFVCKLNPVTTDEDLEIIFSRFGKIVSCEVIRDKKSGDSLQYAFIEFSDKKSCEDAYFKMDNVLIDDRRIHVDFSQSVSKIKWLGKGRGVKHFTDEEIKEQRAHKGKSKRPLSRERDSRSDIREHSRREKNKTNNSARYKEENHDKNRSRDRQHRDDNKSDLRSRRDRSRSKRERSNSLPRNEKSTKRPSKKESNHCENDSRSQPSEKQRSDNKRNNYNNERKEHDHDSTSNKSRSKSSPSKNLRPDSRASPPRSSSKKYEEKLDKTVSNDNYAKDRSRKDYQRDVNHASEKLHNNEISRNKLKHKYQESQEVQNKKSKQDEDHKKTRPSTPSLKVKKGEKKGTKKSQVRKKTVKKKRKPSTSSSDSDSSSDSSSSSSESSSTSDSDLKKKRVRRKRKRSSSSSTSSSSSSSSSTSDTSSESTSSSSDDEVKKKQKTKTNSKKKLAKKTKKK